MSPFISKQIQLHGLCHAFYTTTALMKKCISEYFMEFEQSIETVITDIEPKTYKDFYAVGANK